MEYVLVRLCYYVLFVSDYCLRGDVPPTDAIRVVLYYFERGLDSICESISHLTFASHRSVTQSVLFLDRLP